MREGDDTSATQGRDGGAALSDSLAALAAAGRMRRYARGTVLITEGDEGGTLYIVLKGRVRVYAESASGQQITFGSYAAGDYVGEMSLDGGPRSASVVTTEPTTCSIVDRHAILEHLRTHPQFAMELLERVIGRARAATLSMRQIALNDVYGRLVSLLGSLAEPVPGLGLVIVERLTHQEIANRLGCSREMVSRLMKDLERGGYIALNGRQIVLCKPFPARW